eukprot:6049813-Amphidinium_carterae.2
MGTEARVVGNCASEPSWCVDDVRVQSSVLRGGAQKPCFVFSHFSVPCNGAVRVTVWGCCVRAPGTDLHGDAYSVACECVVHVRHVMFADLVNHHVEDCMWHMACVCCVMNSQLGLCADIHRGVLWKFVRQHVVLHNDVLSCGALHVCLHAFSACLFSVACVMLQRAGMFRHEAEGGICAPEAESRDCAACVSGPHCANSTCYEQIRSGARGLNFGCALVPVFSEGIMSFHVIFCTGVRVRVLLEVCVVHLGTCELVLACGKDLDNVATVGPVLRVVLWQMDCEEPDFEAMDAAADAAQIAEESVKEETAVQGEVAEPEASVADAKADSG